MSVPVVSEGEQYAEATLSSFSNSQVKPKEANLVVDPRLWLERHNVVCLAVGVRPDAHNIHAQCTSEVECLNKCTASKQAKAEKH